MRDLMKLFEEKKQFELMVDGIGVIATFDTHEEARKVFDFLVNKWMEIKDTQHPYWIQ